MNADNFNDLRAVVDNYNNVKLKFLEASRELSKIIDPLYKEVCYKQGPEAAIDWLCSHIPDSVARVIAINLCLQAEQKELLPNSIEMQSHLYHQSGLIL